MTADLEAYKHRAAEQALELVRDGMRLGLGTGSTAHYVVTGLAERLYDGRLHDIVGVPTSDATAKLARSLDVPLATLDELPLLDLAIDGADEIDPVLNLTKGLGGALLREKIVASSAKTFVVVADETKIVPALGTRTPLPIEVIPFGRAPVERHLRDLGGTPTLRHTTEGGVFHTDEGNIILDCHFPHITEPATLNTAIHAIAGVVEHGLFIGIATTAFIAGRAGVTVMRREG